MLRSFSAFTCKPIFQRTDAAEWAKIKARFSFSEPRGGKDRAAVL